MGVINVKKTEAILRIPLLHTHTHTLAQNDFFFRGNPELRCRNLKLNCLL